MATLTVTQSPTHDFTGDLTLGVDQIVFNAGGATTALFNSAQFNGTLISPSVHLTGDAFANTIQISMASDPDNKFSAISFTFSNWSAKFDLVSIIGSSGADEIRGSVQENRITGGGGADTITGGASNDVLVYTATTDLVAGESIDGSAGSDTILLQASGAFNFSSKEVLNIEVLQFTAADAVALLGPAQVGAAAISTIRGSTGAQSIQIDGTSVDLSAVTFTGWTDGEDSITVFGTSTANSLIGSAQRDRLSGFGEADSLDGRGGDDLMQGGAGDDNYVVGETGDVVDEGEPGSDGIDTVRSQISFSLSDTTHVKGSVENLVLLSGAANATGNGLANVLTGNDSANVLDGRAGADTMRGRGGGDTYIVDDPADVVNENIPGSDGLDTVRSSISFSLSDAAHVFGSVENLTLTGSAATATGNALANTLIGNGSANTLNGLEGSDILRGLGGNDIYIVQNIGDVIDESQPGSGGKDEVRSSVSFDLGVSALGAVENLVLTGNGAIGGTGNNLDNLIIGNASANLLVGGGGDDTLDGAGGADAMRGGAGNDTYLVDDVLDAIDETPAGSGGADTVRSGISFSLADNPRVLGAVENLVLLGTAENGTGNALANILTGNALANALDGAAGNDTMRGLGGNDTYVVRQVNDVVDESVAGSGGNDSVLAHVSYSLAAKALGSVENLTLLGTAVNGTGSAIANILTGNALANTLDGRAGNDTMRGLGGNDTYVVDSLGDVVDESVAGSGGSDTVLAAVSFNLGAGSGASVSLAPAATALGSVENLALTGSAVEATGNALANTVTGNAGANTLDGGDGTDVLDGGNGNDRLIGGLGVDLLTGGPGGDAFVFLTLADSGKKKTARDTIVDFDPDDLIDLSAIDAKTGGEDNRFKFIKKQPFHDKKGELRFQKKAGDVIVSGDVDGNGKADFAVLLDGINKVVKGDFVL